MDDFIYVGKIVNTHGIKGEVRILSNFEYKDKVFVLGMPIYIGRKKEKEIIRSFRHHKNFEMITMEGYTDINQVLRYKGLYVYVRREDLSLENHEYLDSDYVGLSVYVKQELKGIIKEIRMSGGSHKLFVVENEKREILVPFHSDFISHVDMENKRIEFQEIKGLFE